MNSSLLSSFLDQFVIRYCPFPEYLISQRPFGDMMNIYGILKVFLKADPSEENSLHLPLHPPPPEEVAEIMFRKF